MSRHTTKRREWDLCRSFCLRKRQDLATTRRFSPQKIRREAHAVSAWEESLDDDSKQKEQDYVFTFLVLSVFYFLSYLYWWKFKTSTIIIGHTRDNSLIVIYTNGNKKYKSKNHRVYSCQYHVIFCPKYRRNVLTDGVDIRLKEIFYWNSGYVRIRNSWHGGYAWSCTYAYWLRPGSRYCSVRSKIKVP